MKRTNFIPQFLIVALLTLFITSCAGSLKPLDAKYVEVNPKPLTLKGGKVPVTITINFPPKWFHKNAEVRITPALRYSTGEAWGSTTTLQGENVRGNSTSVSYAKGGKVTIYTEFTYKPDMQKSELYLTFTSRVGKKSIELPAIKVGEGVRATETLASAQYVTPAIAPDKFQRIIKEKYDANILFLIQQANLRSGELNKEDVREWKGIVKSADITPNQRVSVEVQAYASPDGGVDLNRKLATQREKNTTNYLKQQLKRANVDAPVDAHYTAEDWEGFKTLVEQSNIQDKDLILRVLSMYPDPETREREIKNISGVFKQVADDILPQLRRSRLIANVEIIGKSDDELKQLAKELPNKLTVDELLYAATLVSNDKSKKEIYKAASQIYPKDPRAFNNIGVMAYEAGDLPTAQVYFNTAAKVAQAAGVVVPQNSFNIALLNLSHNQVSEAEQILGSLGDVTELNEGLGLLFIKQGKHAEAAKLLNNTYSNNAVIAQILTNNYNRALELLKGIKHPDATTYYLQAILGARTMQSDMLAEGIRKAVTANPGLALTIIKDREFGSYVGTPLFNKALKGE